MAHLINSSGLKAFTPDLVWGWFGALFENWAFGFLAKSPRNLGKIGIRGIVYRICQHGLELAPNHFVVQFLGRIGRTLKRDANHGTGFEAEFNEIFAGHTSIVGRRMESFIPAPRVGPLNRSAREVLFTIDEILQRDRRSIFP
jgi:hypothetical protein